METTHPLEVHQSFLPCKVERRVFGKRLRGTRLVGRDGAVIRDAPHASAWVITSVRNPSMQREKNTDVYVDVSVYGTGWDCFIDIEQQKDVGTYDMSFLGLTHIVIVTLTEKNAT